MSFFNNNSKRVVFTLISVFIFSCQDLEETLKEDLTVSSSNEMYALDLTVSNNVTDTYTPIEFTTTVTRLKVDVDTANVVSNQLIISEENERYRLDLEISNDVTDYYTPVDFTASVTRTSLWEVREDSKIIGIWKLHKMTIDSASQNVSQFPTDYEFYSDQSYSKIETNTVSGVSAYLGGAWDYEASSKTSGQLNLKMMGNTTIVGVNFDHEGFMVPLEGFMMWEYSSDGKIISETLQKIELSDSALFVEPETYLSISSAGGSIDGYTEPELLDIPITLPNEIGSNYEVAGSFVPTSEFNEGSLLATLIGDSITAINAKSSIEIVDILTDTTSTALLSISSVGGTVEGFNVVEMVNIPVELANNVSSVFEVSGSFVPAFDYEKGNLLATFSDSRFAILNLNIPIRIRIKNIDD